MGVRAPLDENSVPGENVAELRGVVGADNEAKVLKVVKLVCCFGMEEELLIERGEDRDEVTGTEDCGEEGVIGMVEDREEGVIEADEGVTGTVEDREEGVTGTEEAGEEGVTGTKEAEDERVTSSERVVLF